ncbi:MAG: hypothetical protein Q9M09_03705 [Mariprofundaceae bacterium]|nr:hypothetical protein [Mariprofundaceae bacterium]
MLPCLYQYIADANQISMYSHEYDVMMMGKLDVISTEGFVAEYINNEGLDSEAFQVRWHAEKLHQKMADIALQYMDISKLEDAEGLRAALLAAYQLGRSC